MKGEWFITVGCGVQQPLSVARAYNLLIGYFMFPFDVVDINHAYNLLIGYFMFPFDVVVINH
jgi:hypothetical protein